MKENVEAKKKTIILNSITGFRDKENQESENFVIITRGKRIFKFVDFFNIMCITLYFQISPLPLLKPQKKTLL